MPSTRDGTGEYYCRVTTAASSVAEFNTVSDVRRICSSPCRMNRQS
ncbi:MAG: hypothetical protein M3X11_22965 [Acidobacteriota bacterium]|nr:hypothetical protein [Acidobacteriota bacterium]